MTNTQADGTNLVVVDGSNIATEGRSIPSLAQLNDAVISLTEEFPGINVTVVVDATFGHRIDKSEVRNFDEAVAHNELVTPPAGAIGRGDAFVLSIANKVGARIFSNDSFQEFHGVYTWLFDEGRLIGGKPVPNVGWVFVNRVPVKGPVSRKARGAGRDASSVRRPSSAMANLPMPIPTTPPPRATKAARATVAAEAEEVADAVAERVMVDSAPRRSRRRRVASDRAESGEEACIGVAAPASTPSAPPSGGPVNDLLPFLDFIQNHPVGSTVTGAVDSYSSHGAYVTVGDLRGYVPLRLMGKPPPRSAREVMRLGEQATLVVASFAPARRSVDLAVPDVFAVADGAAEAVEPSPGRRRATSPPSDASAPDTASPRSARSARSAPKTDGAEPATKKSSRKESVVGQAIAEQPAAAKTGGRTAAKSPGTTTATRSAAKKTAAKKAAAKKAAAKTSSAKEPAVAKTSATEPATARAAKRTASKLSAAAASPPHYELPAEAATPAKRSARRSTTTGRSPAPATTTSPASKSPVTKSPATKSAVTKSAVTKSAVTKSSVTKSPVTKSPATRSPATKSPATKSPAKKAAATTPTAGAEAQADTNGKPAPRRRRAQATPGR